MQELEKILEEIEQAKREHWYRLNNYDARHKLDGAINRIVDIIRNHVDDGWIPVEERLPEVGQYVLGTTKSVEVLIFRYGWNSPHSKKMFFHLCGAAANIIAWRPLPEPYRPERRTSDD